MQKNRHELKNIMDNDVVKLNQLIREKSLPVIGIKKEEKKKD